MPTLTSTEAAALTGTMNRRELIRGGAAAMAVAALPRFARAAPTCVTPGPQFSDCSVAIPLSQHGQLAQQQLAQQQMNQWCWAACIDSIFRYGGFTVPQQDIVTTLFGAAVNQPATSQQVVATLLHVWTSGAAQFRSWGDHFSASLLNVVVDVDQGRPVIVGTLGHAMVVLSVAYRNLHMYQTSQILSVQVWDPWPGNGVRQLSPSELMSPSLEFIRVHMTPLSGPSAGTRTF